MLDNDILSISDKLKSNIWINNKLSSPVRSKLIAVAKDFFDKLELEGSEIEDITFTGSLANYNYTKYSDIDLHLLVDFSKIDDNYDLVREFFSAKTTVWNNKHNITIFGFEIEIYIQDVSEKHHSTGVYSILNDEWLAKPFKVKPDVDTDSIKRKVTSFIDMIERVEDMFDDKKFEQASEIASNLVSKIKKFRKSGLEDKGEYSNENLAFKYLRNYKYIDLLHKLRNDSYDRMMSLDGKYHRKFKIFINQDINEEKAGFYMLNEIEPIQKKYLARHSRMKKRLISHGNQNTGSSFPKKPNYKRGESAPPMGESYNA
jgi:predicted nucleotidyltransferase